MDGYTIRAVPVRLHVDILMDCPECGAQMSWSGEVDAPVGAPRATIRIPCENCGDDTEVEQGFDLPPALSTMEV